MNFLHDVWIYLTNQKILPWWIPMFLVFGGLGLWLGHWLWYRFAHRISLGQQVHGRLDDDITKLRLRRDELRLEADAAASLDNIDADLDAGIDAEVEADADFSVGTGLAAGAVGAGAAAAVGAALTADADADAEIEVEADADLDADVEPYEFPGLTPDVNADFGKADTVSVSNDISTLSIASGEIGDVEVEDSTASSLGALGAVGAAAGAAGLVGAAALSGDDSDDDTSSDASIGDFTEEDFGPEPEEVSVESYAHLEGRYPGEDVLVKTDLGLVFVTAPDCQDDLTDIKGVGPAISKKLNESGIYRFQQIADWNDYNVWAFNKVLAFPGRIERDEWISQANDLAPTSRCLATNQEEADEEEADLSTEVEVESSDLGAAAGAVAGTGALAGVMSSEFGGEDVSEDADFGIVYGNAPSDVDDLTKISGIGSATERQLNSAGVYQYRQIAHWEDQHIDAVSDRLNLENRVRSDEWVPQAQGLISSASDSSDESDTDEGQFSDDDFGVAPELPDESLYEGASAHYPGEPVRVSRDLGVLFLGKPGCKDDLTEIKGVGPVLEGKLHADGVYRFQQIADWNEYNVWAFNKRLSFPGRIERDEWIAQAKDLAPNSNCLVEVAEAEAEEEIDISAGSSLTGGDSAEEDSNAGIAAGAGAGAAALGATAVAASSNDESDSEDSGHDYSGVIADSFEGEDVYGDNDLGVLYRNKPDSTDDLTEINGIGSPTEKRLNDYGVYRFNQIANWNEVNSAQFDSRLNCEGRIESDEWIPQAKGLAENEIIRANTPEEPEPDAPVETAYEGFADKYDGEDVRTDNELGVLFNDRAHCADDLTEIKGIGKVLAAKLNETGVYRFQQIADWNDYNVWSFNRIISFPGRIQRDEWITQAGNFAPNSKCLGFVAEAEEAKTEPKPWPHVPSEADIRARAQELSAWRDKHAVSGSEKQDWILAERELYRTEGGLSDADAKGHRAAFYLDGEASDSIEGIDQETRDELARLGFVDAASISQMSADDQERVSAWFKGRGLSLDLGAVRAHATASVEASDESDGSDEQGIAADDFDYSSVLSQSFAGESVSATSRLGVVYDSKPDSIDDLTEIKGVGNVIEGRLNDFGVYRFKQIANWNDGNVEEFNGQLEFSGRIEREDWIPQAQRLADREKHRSTAVEEPEPDLPEVSAYDALLQKYPDEDMVTSREYGIGFSGAPECADDLTEISGIGKVLSGRLNDEGIYRWQQIADWNGYNVWAFNKKIDFPGRIEREEWVSQAAALAPTSSCVGGGGRVSEEQLGDVISSEFEGEDVEVKPPFGIIYRSAPATQDDLKLIWGVGPVLEKKLHSFGVYRFKQIANWPDEAIDEFQQQLSFPDRIRRDGWVKQAVEFADKAERGEL